MQSVSSEMLVRQERLPFYHKSEEVKEKLRALLSASFVFDPLQTDADREAVINAFKPVVCMHSHICVHAHTHMLLGCSHSYVACMHRLICCLHPHTHMLRGCTHSYVVCVHTVAFGLRM